MLVYPKIKTVYERDPETNFKTVLEGRFAKPEFEFLKDNTWIFTEKVDGTNIRVFFQEGKVIFKGKSDSADTPPFLLKKLHEMFPVDVFTRWDAPQLVLFGEGYGARIQKGGGNYIPTGVSFILFDVMIDNIWLERHNVEDIADKLGIQVVPIVAKGPLMKGAEMVKHGYESLLSKAKPEGLVMRPEVELFNRRGERIITKIKANDFKS
jgi:ATP-dependent RNA circularization protein (DNA/RNA ligase family)